MNGKWHDEAVNASNKNGKYIRQESKFRDQILACKSAKYTAEANRYHLYISYACPWAHRTLIARALKNLEDLISVSVVSPYMLEDGWTFDQDLPGCTGDKLYSKDYLHEIYTEAKDNISGKVTVPVLWDKNFKTIVNNESADILRMLNTAFVDQVEVPSKYNLYPEALSQEIDKLNAYIYDKVNNGVYKTGFATKQDVYEHHFRELFAALEHLDHRLENDKYLFGENLVETDIRLFTTLIRFDLVYYSHFKCNQQQIADYKNLYRYLKDIYEIPKIKNTVNFDHIKTHYYASQRSINPTGIVPVGPLKVL